MQFMNSSFHSHWNSLRTYLGSLLKKKRQCWQVPSSGSTMSYEIFDRCGHSLFCDILNFFFPGGPCRTPDSGSPWSLPSLLQTALGVLGHICLQTYEQHASYAAFSSWLQMWFPWLLPILGKFLLNQTFGRCSGFILEHICLGSSPPKSRNVDTEHPHSCRSQDGFIWVTRSRDDSMLPGYVRSSSHIQLKRGLLSTTDHLMFIYQQR